MLAIYSGNEPSVMRLMPSLVIGEAEVDFLLAAPWTARSPTCSSGAGPEEAPRARPTAPAASATARLRSAEMADWDELAEALADYTISCNENERLRKMQRDWSRILHFVCSDTGTTFSMDVDRGEILSTPDGPRRHPGHHRHDRTRRPSATCSGAT